MEAAADRALRDGESSVALVIAYDRVLFRSVTDEVAVRHPLRLHEFELLLQVRADQQKNAAALRAVIVQDPFRQRRSIVRATPQKVVETYSHNVSFQGIARVYAPHVRTERALQTLHVVFIAEHVIAICIRA